MSPNSTRNQLSSTGSVEAGGYRGSSPHMRFALLGVLVTALVTCALVIGAQVPVPTASLVGINAASVFLCGFDKSIAGGKKTRVPEIVLLSFAAVGGTPGLLVGLVFFRHKTRKAAFILKFALIVLVQLVLFRSLSFSALVKDEELDVNEVSQAVEYP